MTKTILITVIGIAAVLAIFKFPLLRKEEKTDWLALVNRKTSEFVDLGYQFTALTLNGDTLQRQLSCDKCPMKIKINARESGFNIQSKSILKRRNIDTLRLHFEYNHEIQNRLLFQPMFTYIVHSECDTISKLVYKKVMERLDIANSKVTNSDSINRKGEIDLNDVFSQLKDKELGNWMSAQKSSQPTLVSEDCTKYLKALEYISNGNQSGFLGRAYNLQKASLHENQELLGYLTSINEVLRGVIQQFNGAKGDLEITVTGYTDQRTIDSPIIFEKEQPNDQVFYDVEKCSTDYSEGLQPIPFIVNDNDKLLYKEIVNSNQFSSNCALSALRAYYATKYIRNNLSDQLSKTKIRYYYCAGGISFGDELAKQRKISVSIKFIGVNKN